MGVIEKNLLEKLEAAIDDAKSSNYSTHFSPNVSQLYEDLKDLIAETPIKTGVKEKLYSLSNLLLLLKNGHHLSLETRRWITNLQQSLTDIKKNTSSDEKAEDVIKDPKFYRWSTRLADPTVKIYGFENRAMERLLVRTERKNGFKVIGIFGMAGVGKTALCQVSFDNRQVKEHFFPRIWVCMSKQPKDDATNSNYPHEVVKRILMCLGFDNEVIDRVEQEGKTRRLLLALRRQLEGKRYLVVLDDAWHFDKFWCLSTLDKDEDEDTLSYGLPRGHGGAVIVTSRSEKMAEYIVGEKNLNCILPDKESGWDIFMGSVKKDAPSVPKNLEELKDTVVIKCGGLPSAAKMMGQIVHEKIKNKKENQQNQSGMEMPTQEP